MRLTAVILAALLLLAAPAGARKRHHRAARWRATPPVAWTFLPPVSTPAPMATAAPTATPVATAAPSAAPTATATPGSTLPPPNTHSVSVLSKEYSFTLSQVTVSAGQVHIQFDNSQAEDAHELAIDGPDPAYWDFGKEDAGTVTQHTITLDPGTYVLFCPLADHEARGMHATLTVH